jgi:phosphoglycolate phosphatase
MSIAPVAIVLDLDGTLVDSIHDLTIAVSALLGEHGRRPLDADEVRRMVGDGLRTLLQRAFTATGDPPEDALLDVLVPTFTSHYNAHSTEHTRPYPGVVATLGQLKAAGHRLGIATNKPQVSTDRLLGALGLAPYFHAVAGGDRHPFRKPDPRHPLAVVEAIGGRPERALVVGDDWVDLQAGHGAGLPVALATWGYARRPYDTLDAEAHLARFDELLPLLERLFR